MKSSVLIGRISLAIFEFHSISFNKYVFRATVIFMNLHGTITFMSLVTSKILLLIVLLGIIVFAFAPGHWTPAWVVNHDKFSHMLVFFILAFMAKYSFPKINILTQVSLLIAFAIVIELMQLKFFNRGFSGLDLLYGLLGISLFYLMIKVFHLTGIKQYFRIKMNNETIE